MFELSMKRTDIILEKVANSVLQIASGHRLNPELAVYDLTVSSGYFEHHDNIRADLLRERLVALPDAIGEWLLYSEDKRTPSGWCFRTSANTSSAPCHQHLNC